MRYKSQLTPPNADTCTLWTILSIRKSLGRI